MASLICGRPPEAPRNQGFMPGEENLSDGASGEIKNLVVIKPRRRLRESKGLTPSAWRKALDPEGRPTNIAKLLGKVQRGGIHPSIRPEVWELLLGVWSIESTAEERTNLRNKHRLLYAKTLEQCRQIHPGLGTGKLAYAVNDSRVPDARSSFHSFAGDAASEPDRATQSNVTVSPSDGNEKREELEGSSTPNREPEQLGWGAKFLFDIAKRGFSPEGKEGQPGQGVLLEYYTEEGQSEGEVLTQGLGAEFRNMGLGRKGRTQDAGPEAETQGLGVESLTPGFGTGAERESSGAIAETEGFGAGCLTPNLATRAGTNQPGAGTETQVSTAESFTQGAGVSLHGTGAAIESQISWTDRSELREGLQDQAEEVGAGRSEESSIEGGSVLTEAPEYGPKSSRFTGDSNPDMGLELTPGLLSEVGPPGLLTEGIPDGLVDPELESMAPSSLRTGSETAVGGVPKEKSSEPLGTPEMTPGVTSKPSPEVGLLETKPESVPPLMSETEPPSSLTLGETANPVAKLTLGSAVGGGQEKATGVGKIAVESQGPESTARPQLTPAGLGRVKTMVAKIEQRTLDEAAANRQGLRREPPSGGGVRRGLGSSAAETVSGLQSGGVSERGLVASGLSANHKVVRSAVAGKEGVFAPEGGQLGWGENSAVSGAEPIGTGSAGVTSARGAISDGEAESAKGAESVREEESVGGAESVRGAESGGGAESVGGAESHRGAEFVKGAESSGGVESNQGTETSAVGLGFEAVGAEPGVLTSAVKQETRDFATGFAETGGLPFGPGPLSRSKSSSVIPTKRVTTNLEDNPGLEDDEGYTTPGSRFTAFSTPDAGFFTPDRSLSAFSTPRSAAYATPDEGFFTPEKGSLTPQRRGRSASASPAFSNSAARVSKSVSAKPSDWDARKGGAALGFGVNTGDSMERGTGVNTGPRENRLAAGDVATDASSGTGVNTGGELFESASVNRTEGLGTRGVRCEVGSDSGGSFPVASSETGVMNAGKGEQTLNQRSGETGSFVLGAVEPVVVRKSRPLRSEPNPEEPGAKLPRPADADISTGSTADVSASNAADVSKSKEAKKGAGKGSTDLLLVVENGSHLTALGQGPVYTASLRAVTLGRVNVNPGELTVEWTGRGGQSQVQTAPLVVPKKRRSLLSSNATPEEGETEPTPPGLVNTGVGQISVGTPAGVRLTGPEAEHAGEWLWTLHRIVVDVVRTDRHLAFYDVTANLARMTDILAVYAWRDPEVGYCQGMSDLLSPFVVLFQDDAEAFWCFERLMSRVRHNFGMRGPVGVLRQLDQLREIVDITDPTVGKHLRAADADNFLFAFRMLLVMFRRELSFSQVVLLWEMTWAADFERNGPGRNGISAESGRNEGRNGLPAGVAQSRNRTGHVADVGRNGGRVETLGDSKRNGAGTEIPADSDRSGTGNGGVFDGTKGAGGVDEGPEKGEEGVDCGDELFVYCVAAILHHNRARLKAEVREMDDAVKLFNGMELRVDVRRCVESAVKCRKAFMRKTQAKG